MGLFSKRKCDICGKEIGIMGVISLVEGIACKECFSKSGMNRLNGLPHINEVRDRINGKKILKTYTATHKIDNVIMLNVEDKTWTAFPFAKIYKFKDLIDYEIIENGSTVSSKGIGRAIAGGLLFGGVGAIIGGVTAKSKTKNILNGLFLKIVINDFDNPNLMIDLLTVKKPITNPIGIQTVMFQSFGQLIFEYTTLPSSSREEITKPPTTAGVMLSGWFSISVAIERRAASSAGFPKSSLAAINPPTITAAELPKPLAIGICVFIVIFNSLGVWPIELYKSSIAL